MNFWLLSTMLCSAAAVAISIPLIRRYEQAGGTAQESAVYQDQIKEVERDMEAGVINAPEAQAAKAEINRRIDALQRDSVAARPISNGWRTLALVASAGLVILGGVNLYGYMGSPNMPSATPAPQAAAAQQATPQASAQQQASDQNAAAGQQPATQAQVDAVIAKLKDKLKADPGNAEGWRTLGWALFNTQKYQESVDAYGKALAIDPNNVDYKSAMAESIVQAAQGTVTPKAQDLINDVLAKQPKDLRARFYDALGHEQSGDQQGALDRWLALLADAPADAGWRDDVKARAADLAKALGKDVSAQLNAGAAAAAPAEKQIGQGEKNAMVSGMIAQLAAKLQANPKDRDGWAMMIRSLIVTGDQKGADEALAKALDIFKDDKATQDGLKQVAQEATAKQAAGAGAGAAAAAPAPADGSAAPQISADQQAMILGMVQKLADRLKANPKDADGWTRLMRAYQVLKDTDKAKAAYADALKAFDGDAAAQDKLKAAAGDLGLN
ncbi:MAG: c-type cytochrome biogenesis protein CcmI [Alphaproteobacteria bacterium]|nr:c-type cytochrome biogenesis protein CcmI [Alphaproteobacteria bacterium]